MLLAASKRDSSQSELSDAQLVLQVQGGNKEAYRELVERYQSRGFNVARRILNSEEDAEDVVQEAFVKAYLSIKSFKGDSKFYTWFYRIVYNMAIDVRRKKQRRGGDSLEYIEDIASLDLVDSTNGTPEAQLSSKQELGKVQEAISELSEDHREVVVMREIDGLAYDEIADLLGVNKGTVMSRLFYARKNLMKVLSRPGTIASNGSSSSAEEDYVMSEKL